MSRTANESGHWPPCPPGELARTAARLRRQSRLHRIARASAASAVILLAAGTLYLRFGPSGVLDCGESNDGGITCTESHRVITALKACRVSYGTLASDLISAWK